MPGASKSGAWFICGCVLQVQAGNLTPVTALVQNLLMSALFEPFEALCSAANAEMAEVCEPN